MVAWNRGSAGSNGRKQGKKEDRPARATSWDRRMIPDVVLSILFGGLSFPEISELSRKLIKQIATEASKRMNAKLKGHGGRTKAIAECVAFDKLHPDAMTRLRFVE